MCQESVCWRVVSGACLLQPVSSAMSLSVVSGACLLCQVLVCCVRSLSVVSRACLLDSCVKRMSVVS